MDLSLALAVGNASGGGGGGGGLPSTPAEYEAAVLAMSPTSYLRFKESFLSEDVTTYDELGNYNGVCKTLAGGNHAVPGLLSGDDSNAFDMKGNNDDKMVWLSVPIDEEFTYSSLYENLTNGEIFYAYPPTYPGHVLSMVIMSTGILRITDSNTIQVLDIDMGVTTEKFSFIYRRRIIDTVYWGEVFIDGVLLTSYEIPLADTELPITNNIICIGSKGVGGIIDEQTIIPRAISDSEIAILSSGAATPPAPQVGTKSLTFDGSFWGEISKYREFQGDFQFEFEFSTTATGIYNTFISNEDDSTFFRIDNLDNFNFNLTGQGGGGPDASPYLDGKKHVYKVVRNGTIAKTYVDDVELDSRSVTALGIQNLNCIGKRFTGTANAFIGTIYSVRLYDLDNQAGTLNYTFNNGKLDYLESDGYPIQENNVENGDFADGTDWWNWGAGWSHVSGVARATNVNGTDLYQTGRITADTAYQITYTVSNYVQGDCNFVFNAISTGRIDGEVHAGNGTFVQVIRATDSVNNNFSIRGHNNFTADIDDIIIQEIPRALIYQDVVAGDWADDTEDQDDAFEAYVKSLEPAAYFRLGELSGEAVHDKVGPHHGRYYGPTLGEASLIDGSTDTSVYFDGVDDTIWFGNAPRLYDAYSYSYVASFIYRGENLIVIGHSNNTPVAGVVQGILVTNGVAKGYINSGGAQYSANGATALQIGTKYQAVFTRHSVNGMKIYLNGALDGSNAGSASAIAKPEMIAGQNQNSGDWQTMTEDEIILFNRELPLTEIENLYKLSIGQSID